MTGAHRVLIADDDAPARTRIRDLLAGRTEYEIVGECDSGPAALAALRALRPDIVFLDVQMPGQSGLQVVAQLAPDERSAIVFTTAYEQYALDAFDASAIDYLLKPFTDERFQEALHRAGQLLKGRTYESWRRQFGALIRALEVTPANREPIRRFAARHQDRIAVIESGAVDWIGASGDYLTLHVGRERHLVRMRMHEVEERLDPDRFVRIHRSAIVHLERVAGLEADSAGEDILVLRDGTRLRVSRGYRQDVRGRLGLESGER